MFLSIVNSSVWMCCCWIVVPTVFGAAMPLLKLAWPLNTLASSQRFSSINACIVFCPPSIITDVICCVYNALQTSEARGWWVSISLEVSWTRSVKPQNLFVWYLTVYPFLSNVAEKTWDAKNVFDKFFYKYLSLGVTAVPQMELVSVEIILLDWLCMEDCCPITMCQMMHNSYIPSTIHTYRVHVFLIHNEWFFEVWTVEMLRSCAIDEFRVMVHTNES